MSSIDLTCGREKESISNEVGRIAKMAIARSMGYRVEDFKKPFIGVIHGWNELSPGDFHLKALAQYAKRGIIEAGGTPAEIIIPGLCGEMKGCSSVRRYPFVYRDFAAAMVEIFVNLHCFDGVLYLSTCDNQLPAYLIGASRTDVPSIFVTGGYMPPGEYENRPITIFDVIKGYGEVVKGKLDQEHLNKMIACACPSAGACPEVGTANTMCAVTEALGMSFPGNATIAANDIKLSELAREAGNRLLRLVEDDITPSKIMTPESIENAIRLVLAIGGSTNAVIHITAIAQELGINFGMEIWDQFSRETPFICGISPNVPGYYMNDLEKAGGIPAVMKELLPILNTNVMNVNGKILADNLKEVIVENREIIRPINEPINREGGIVILKGNIAEKGALVKQSGIISRKTVYKGRAKVFDSEEDAIESLIKGNIGPKDIMVIRYEGPKGSPGSREMVNIMHCLVGMGLSDSVALVTDGRISGTNLGLAVVHVSPEAMERGGIAIVENGDKIVIDIPRRKITLDVGEEEFNRRTDNLVLPEPRITRGVLGAYAKLARSFAEGARVF